MKKVAFLSLLLTLALGVFACKSATKEEPLRNDGMLNSYYLEGVTLTPLLPTTGF